MRVPDKGFTHAGVFHADDVFAAALLKLLNPNIAIERGCEAPENYDGIVFDIGGGRFDHHGPHVRARENGVPYASFGLVWEEFSDQLLCQEDAQLFDESFVQPIDAADNGGNSWPITQLVADFNPLNPSDVDEYDHRFFLAVDWALGVLERRLASINAAREARTYVERRMQECGGRILVLDHIEPWKAVVAGSTYAYVIYPSVRGGYNVQAVPKSASGRKTDYLFPVSWRGVEAVQLRRSTGVRDAIFCHPSGYLCAASSLQGAISMAEAALDALSGNPR